MQNRTLYFGDNLDILREKIPDESFDLIYLDPPFNSNRDYNVLFKEGPVDSQAQVQAFEDSWHWTEDAERTFGELIGERKSETPTNQKITDLMLALEKMVGQNDVLDYLTMMAIRLIELRQVLRPAGSIYLHCDPTASHYLKIVMDAIFGKQNFRNEIIWSYNKWAVGQKIFSRNHDVILFYCKDAHHLKFNVLLQPRALSTLKRFGNKKIVSAIDPATGRRIPSQVEEGESEGVKMSDVWQVPIIAPVSKERLGYPTQKPEALLERIIKASSNEGDWVLDPFCGCGTTVAVAERLNRNWVGIDVTALAINLIKRRLHDHHPGIGVIVDGLPKDLAGARALFAKDPFEFEYWVLDLLSATPGQSKSREQMRGADKGIDGIMTILMDIQSDRKIHGRLVVQVKGGKIERKDIAALKGDVEREKAAGGVFVTLEDPTRPMQEEAVQAGRYTVPYAPGAEFPRIQILTVKDLLAGVQPRMPIWVEPYHKPAKRAERERPEWQQGFKLGTAAKPNPKRRKSS